MMDKLCFATNNPHKLREIEELVTSFELVGLSEIGCTEDIPETQPTIAGNSAQKAQYVWENYGVNCFADDTGLEVFALGNEPGVFSARYAGPERDPENNMALLLKNLLPHPNRGARFLTVVTLILEGKATQFEGEVLGTILPKKQGDGGFGYDPIFLPNGYKKTFAEMPSHQKNEISHRGRAMAKLIEFLNC